MKIHVIDFHTAEEHFVSGNGGVDSAREQQQRPSRTAAGEASPADMFNAVNERLLFAYLDADNRIGVMHIDG